MKRCPRCKEIKPKFNFSKRREGQCAAWCKVCMQHYNNRKYAEDPARRSRMRTTRQARYLRTREWFREYVLKQSCIDCGEADVRVLDFDHRDESTKKFNISVMLTLKFSIKRIEEEIAKCDVRCANCHRKRTSDRMSDWRAKAQDQRVKQLIS